MSRVLVRDPGQRVAKGPSTVPNSGVITERLFGWVLLICGAAGAIAALVLTIEKLALLKDPTYVPSCSINPILSCGSVMKSDQAEAFGFPNPLIGLVSFPLVIATGALVVGRTSLPRWWWLGLQAGATFGLVFVHWLMFQSLYRIDALCPYCMVVWVSVIVTFSYVTLFNLERGVLPGPKQLRKVARVHSVVPTVWLLAVAVAIGIRFWSYWRTLL